MPKNNFVTFTQLQESLLKKGMVFSAICNHESYGSMLCNRIVSAPSTGLLPLVKKVALEVLQERFKREFVEKESSPFSKEHIDELVADFADEKEYRKGLDWIDDTDPTKGIISLASREVFGIRVDPGKITQVIFDELGVEFDAMEVKKIHVEIGYLFDDREIEPGAPNEVPGCDFEYMYEIGSVIEGCLKAKRYKEVRKLYMDRVLTPVTANYKSLSFYVASADTSYLAIGRPGFYPIIAAERTDGSIEITIFEAYNSF